MLQLSPTIPVYSLEHEQNGYALVLLDYSQEHNTLFLVALENGELWWLPQDQIRMQPNRSLKRPRPWKKA